MQRSRAGGGGRISSRDRQYRVKILGRPAVTEFYFATAFDGRISSGTLLPCGPVTVSFIASPDTAPSKTSSPYLILISNAILFPSILAFSIGASANRSDLTVPASAGPGLSSNRHLHRSTLSLHRTFPCSSAVALVPSPVPSRCAYLRIVIVYSPAAGKLTLRVALTIGCGSACILNHNRSAAIDARLKEDCE